MTSWPWKSLLTVSLLIGAYLHERMKGINRLEVTDSTRRHFKKLNSVFHRKRLLEHQKLLFVTIILYIIEDHFFSQIHSISYAFKPKHKNLIYYSSPVLKRGMCIRFLQAFFGNPANKTILLLGFLAPLYLLYIGSHGCHPGRTTNMSSALYCPHMGV